MTMTKDLLLERLEILKQELSNRTSAMNQLRADLNAIHGAMEECNFWIEQFDKNAEDDLNV